MNSVFATSKLFIVLVIGSAFYTSSLKAATGQIVADAGEELTLTDDSLATFDDRAFALGAINGGIIDALRLEISTSGQNASGLFADQRGRITLADSRIETRGNGAHGAYALNGADISLTNTRIGTQGYSATGLLLQNAMVTATDTNITTTGGAAMGANASGIDAQLRLTDSTISTSGMMAVGIQVRSGAITNVNSSQITTSGMWSSGTLAQGNSSIRLEDTDILTTGARSYGLNAMSGSVVTASNSSIRTLGDSSHGLDLYQSQIDLKDTDVLAEGLGAQGAMLLGDSTLNMASGSLVSTQGSAIEVSGSNTVNGSVINLSDGAYLRGGNGTLLLLTDNTPGLQLNMDSQTYGEGDIAFKDSSQGLIANTVVTLSNGSHWKGASNGAISHLTLASNSQWTMTNSSTLGQLSLDNSSLSFQVPSADEFKTLTVNGDFTSNGGELWMNTALGADDSNSDKLHILGGSSGQANVHINNVGGLGAQTQEGIMLIEVDGRSDASFALSGRAVGGAYEYFLYKGGKTTPDDGDWYLRSELPEELELPVRPITPVDPCFEIGACSEPPVEPELPVKPTEPIDNCFEIGACSDPVAPIEDPNPVPILRPEVGGYLANRAAAVTLLQHSRDDRMVGRLNDSQAPGAIWLRGQQGQSSYRTVAGQIESDGDSSLLQAGVDLTSWGARNNGKVGVMIGNTNANSTATSRLTGYGANAKVQGTVVGLYSTWLADPVEQDGSYADAWLQYGRYRNEVQGQGTSKEKYLTNALSASLETGYAWPVYKGTRTNVHLEPQAQLTYTDYRGKDHRESNGTRVSFGNSADLTSRLGLSVRSVSLIKGVSVAPYITVNWLHQHNDNTIHFDANAAKGGVARDRLETKAGVQIQVAKRWSGWGQISSQTSSTDYRHHAGQIGLSYSW